MIFIRRNDPNQISKLIDFETRDFEQPSEEDVSYASISDIEGQQSTSNIYRYSNNNSHNNSIMTGNNTSQITSNKNLNNNNTNLTNKSKSKYQKKAMKKTSNKNLPNQNNTPINNSFSSQLSEYAIQRSFNEQLQDKSEGNADSDCSLNFQSGKRDYKPSKNPNIKSRENFCTKKSFVSHYPSTENFQTKNTLGEKFDSERYIAPNKNRAGYTKEDYISDKNEIENIFTNSRNLLKSANINANTNTNSEFNNSIMNTNNFLLGTSISSVSNLGTYYNNQNNRNSATGNAFWEGNINNPSSSNSYLKRSFDKIDINDNIRIEMDNNNNFYNNINNSLSKTNKLMEIKEEQELSGAKKLKDNKLQQTANHFVSENPHDDSWNYYVSRKFDAESNNNFQSDFLYDDKYNKSFLNNNNNTNNNHLSNNDLEILEKIKINEHNDSYYYNYDSDPK